MAVKVILDVVNALSEMIYIARRRLIVLDQRTGDRNKYTVITFFMSRRHGSDSNYGA